MWCVDFFCGGGNVGVNVNANRVIAVDKENCLNKFFIPFNGFILLAFGFNPSAVNKNPV